MPLRLLHTLLFGFVAAVILFSAVGTTLVAAQTQSYTNTEAPNINYTPLAPLPGTGTCKAGDADPQCLPEKVGNLGGYLRGIYFLGISIAGFFVVFSIVRGGFTLLFTDSILGHSEAKGIILRALGGALIVYASYILMNQINPALGRDLNLSLELPKIQVTKGLLGQLFTAPGSLQNEAETRRQLRMAAMSSAEREAAVAQEVAELRADADNLEAQANALTNDADKAFLLGLAEEYRNEADLLEHKEGIMGKARAAQRSAINALTYEEAQRAYMAAPGTVAAITEASDVFTGGENRTLPQLVNAHRDAMGQIASTYVQAAASIINNWDSKQAATIPELRVDDREELTRLVRQNMEAIVVEREKRIDALNLLKTDPDYLGYDEYINSWIASVETEARASVQNLRKACHDKNYPCKDLYPWAAGAN